MLFTLNKHSVVITMPKRRRFRKRFRRRRKRRKMSFKSRVKKIMAIGTEKKTLEGAFSNVRANTTLKISTLPMPAQGVGDGQRVGNQIRGRMLDLTVQFRGALGEFNLTPTHPIRMWLIWLKNPAQVVVGPNTFVSHWDYEQNPGIAILWKSQFNIRAQQVSQENNTLGTANAWIEAGSGTTVRWRHMRFNLKNRKFKFNGAVHEQGSLQLLVLGNNAVLTSSEALYDVRMKFWYTDA